MTVIAIMDYAITIFSSAKGCFLSSTAQAIRANLFAKAITTLLVGLRFNSPCSQRLKGSSFLSH
jgi:hypothetical protein